MWIYFILKRQDLQCRIINLFNIMSQMKEHSSANNQFNRTFNNSFHKTSLWKDSQATIPFVSPELSFYNQKRFKWSSIYWPEVDNTGASVKKNYRSQINEEAVKVSKLIDEEQKNEERIKKLKKTFSMAKSQRNSARKQMNAIVSMKKPFKLNQQNQKILLRLMPASLQNQSLLRDRHGNRSNLYKNPEAQQTSNDQRQFLTTGFKTSRKIKLELPHNYYPGPGTYEIKRYLAQIDDKSLSYRRALTARKAFSQRQ